MKKLIIITILACMTFFIQAQTSPFKGFFKPAKEVVQTNYMVSSDVNAATSHWVFRPSLTLTAVAIQLGGSQPLSQSLKSVGTGISYANFSVVNGNPYCNYSLNASLLTQIVLSGQTSETFGASLTADVFNKVIGAGLGYLNQKVFLLTTISYSF
jgi:hypothetical protein